eukprot:3089584-Prymnesium_polylepis.1
MSTASALMQSDEIAIARQAELSASCVQSMGGGSARSGSEPMQVALRAKKPRSGAGCPRRPVNLFCKGIPPRNGSETDIFILSRS